MLTVALTKADRVDEARVDEVERQVKEVLREYGFAEAKLFITAATEGRGIDALREHLLQLPEREHASQHSFRLAIDRAFTVKGAGLVVTGTALSGEVKVGDSLWLTAVSYTHLVAGNHLLSLSPSLDTGDHPAAYKSDWVLPTSCNTVCNRKDLML